MHPPQIFTFLFLSEVHCLHIHQSLYTIFILIISSTFLYLSETHNLPTHQSLYTTFTLLRSLHFFLFISETHNLPTVHQELYTTLFLLHFKVIFITFWNTWPQSLYTSFILIKYFTFFSPPWDTEHSLQSKSIRVLKITSILLKPSILHCYISETHILPT